MRQEQQFVMGGGIQTFKPKKLIAPGNLVDACNYEQAPEGGYRLRKGYEYYLNLYDKIPESWSGFSNLESVGRVITIKSAFSVRHIMQTVAGPVIETGGQAFSSLALFNANGDLVKRYPVLTSPIPEGVGPSQSLTPNVAARPSAIVTNFFGNPELVSEYVGFGYHVYGMNKIVANMHRENGTIRQITRWKDHLVIMQHSALTFSAVGNPDDYESSTSLEIGLSAQGLKMTEYQGSLFVSTLDGLYVIQGNSTDDLQMRKVSDKAPVWMGVIVGQLMLFDITNGLQVLNASNVYGDFIEGSISAEINRVILSIIKQTSPNIYYNENTKQIVIYESRSMSASLPSLVRGCTVSLQGAPSVMPIVSIGGIEEVEPVRTGFPEVNEIYATSGFGTVLKLDKGTSITFYKSDAVGRKVTIPMAGWLITNAHSYGSANQYKQFKMLSVDIDGSEGADISIGVYAGDGDGTDTGKSLESFEQQTFGYPFDADVLQSQADLSTLAPLRFPGLNLGFRYKPTEDIRINLRARTMGLMISCQQDSEAGHTITGCTVAYSTRRRQR